MVSGEDQIEEIWKLFVLDGKSFRGEAAEARKLAADFTERKEKAVAAAESERKMISAEAEERIQRVDKYCGDQVSQFQSVYERGIESLTTFSSLLDKVRGTLTQHKKLVQDIFLFRETQKTLEAAKKNGVVIHPSLESHVSQLEDSFKQKECEMQDTVSRLFLITNAELHDYKGPIGELHSELKETAEYYTNLNPTTSMAVPCDDSLCPFDEAFELLKTGDVNKDFAGIYPARLEGPVLPQVLKDMLAARKQDGRTGECIR